MKAGIDGRDVRRDHWTIHNASYRRHCMRDANSGSRGKARVIRNWTRAVSRTDEKPVQEHTREQMRTRRMAACSFESSTVDNKHSRVESIVGQQQRKVAIG